MENNLIKPPGQTKTLNNIRQKKELNKKIIKTENKIKEIRVRLKQLKGLYYNYNDWLCTLVYVLIMLIIIKVFI